MVQSLDAVAAWRAAGEAGDAAGAIAALSPDVTLVSPITEQFTFQGHRQVRTLLEVALAAIDDITYTDQVAEGRTVALFYEAKIGETRAGGAQGIREPDNRRGGIRGAIPEQHTVAAFKGGLRNEMRWIDRAADLEPQRRCARRLREQIER